MTDGIGKVPCSAAAVSSATHRGGADPHGYRVTTVNRGRRRVLRGPRRGVTADRRDARLRPALTEVDADCVVDVTPTGRRNPDRNRRLPQPLGRFIHIAPSASTAALPLPVAETGPRGRPIQSLRLHKAGCERAILSEPSRPPLDDPAAACRLRPRTLLAEARLCRQIIEERPVIVRMQPFLCQNLFVGDAALAVRLLLESPKRPTGLQCRRSPFTLETM